jgi:hypothetical protein
MFFMPKLVWIPFFSLLLLANGPASDDKEKSQEQIASAPRNPFPGREAELKKLDEIFGEPTGKRLVLNGRIWVDRKNRRVIVDGFIALRNGQLEMFACPAGTKEHESIVALFCKSQEVHTALLAAGAKQGKPTQFDPYKPASGSTIKIKVLWKDAEGEKQCVRAQSWVRHVPTDAEMKFDWVFAGSGVYRDEDSGQTYYLADGGDLICVANFTSATLDLAVRSEDTNTGLAFTTFPDRIPKEGTPVRLVLEVSDDPPATAESEVKEEKIDIKAYEDVFGKIPETKKPAEGNDKSAKEKDSPKNSEQPKSKGGETPLKKTEDSKAESGSTKDAPKTNESSNSKKGGK